MVHITARQSATEWNEVWGSPDMFQLFFILTCHLKNSTIMVQDAERRQKTDTQFYTKRYPYASEHRLTFKK